MERSNLLRGGQKLTAIRGAKTYLPARIISPKGDAAGNVGFTLFFCNFDFLGSLRLRTSTTAIGNDVFNAPEESRVSVQVYPSLFGLIPFRIQDCMASQLDVAREK